MRSRDPRALPRWWIATEILLAIALVVAIAAGRTVEAIFIGILLAPYLVVLAIWIYARLGARR
jgi:hypothetical protein